MDMINMPGFTAEAALNSTKQRYSLAMRNLSVRDFQSVVPQLRPSMGCDFGGGGFCWLCWEEPALGRSYCQIY